MEKNQQWGYSAAVAITPHDTNSLSDIANKGLYVAGAGDLAVEFHNGTSVTFAGVAAKTFLNLHVKRVKATGTTATGIVGLGYI